MDPGVVHWLAAARGQPCDPFRGWQPPSSLGSQAPRRSRLEIRINGTLMNVQPVVVSDANITWELPSRGRVGMYCLISAESAIFSIFFVAYFFYVGKSL